jgi:hypothetical protein
MNDGETSGRGEKTASRPSSFIDPILSDFLGSQKKTLLPLAHTNPHSHTHTHTHTHRTRKKLFQLNFCASFFCLFASPEQFMLSREKKGARTAFL